MQRRSAAMTLSIILVLTILPAGFGRTPPDWVPAAVQNWGFDLLLTAAPISKKITSVWLGSLADDRVYWDVCGEEARFESQGVGIVGTLYRPGRPGQHPALLIVHGSTSEGRKLGLYRLLGREFSARGYLVLAIDLRGYGDSDDPPDIEDVSAFDAAVDVMNGVSYLISFDDVDLSRIFVLAHSGGNRAALSAATQDPRIAKIISIGPPRRVDTRFSAGGNAEQPYFQRRLMREMRLSTAVPEKIYSEIAASMDVGAYLDYFSQPGHVPILLVDGEFEAEEDRRYLQEVFHQMAEPKKYLTLPGMDHYLNTANAGAIVFYDQKAVKEAIPLIENWLAGRAPVHGELLGGSAFRP